MLFHTFTTPYKHKIHSELPLYYFWICTVLCMPSGGQWRKLKKVGKIFFCGVFDATCRSWRTSTCGMVHHEHNSICILYAFLVISIAASCSITPHVDVRRRALTCGMWMGNRRSSRLGRVSLVNRSVYVNCFSHGVFWWYVAGRFQ